MDLNTILIVVSAILGIVATVWGVGFQKIKGKLKAVAVLVKEAYEVVAKVAEILEDDKISPDEIEELKKEAADVKAAFFALIGK